MAAARWLLPFRLDRTYEELKHEHVHQQFIQNIRLDRTYEELKLPGLFGFDPPLVKFGSYL